jgi:Family of unknown function (DUF6221)
MNADDLTAFLKARLAEDEAEAASFAGPPSLRERQRREAEAKRAILAAHPVRPVRNGTCQVCTDVEGTSYLSYLSDQHKVAPPPCPTLRALAAVYSDHPDYRQEWKP